MKTEITTPELMPPETMPAELVRNEALDHLKEQAISFHNEARTHAGLAVVYAAMCGFAIRKKKAELGHGNGFSKWKKGLPFGEGTINNYINLSKELETRAPELQGMDQLTLGDGLGSPELQTPDVDRIARTINDLGGGSNLTKLYHDWGIIKPPHQLGGDPVLQKWLAEFHPRVKGVTRVEDLPPKLAASFGKWCAEQDAEAVRNHDPIKEAQEIATRHYMELRSGLYDFMNRHYADLPRGELRELRDMLSDYAKQLERTLQGA